MASYQVENDIVGGSGFGGFGGFGGSCGFLVVLLILFAVFSGGGIFGRHDGHGKDHDRDFDELRSRFTNPCNCVSNCQIDKDVVTSRDAGILEQKSIYEKGIERENMTLRIENSEQKNQLFLTGIIGELAENFNAKLNCLQKEIERKPNAVPHFAETVDACVREQNRCGRREREEFGFC